MQWNLGIRDTQGTVKNCPQFWSGPISQVYFYVLNRPKDWSSCPQFPGCPYFSGGLKDRFCCILLINKSSRLVYRSSSFKDFFSLWSFCSTSSSNLLQQVQFRGATVAFKNGQQWDTSLTVREITIQWTCLYDRLRNRDNLGIMDNYFSPYVYPVLRNGSEK